jgi:hypothetical protein
VVVAVVKVEVAVVEQVDFFIMQLNLLHQATVLAQ